MSLVEELFLGIADGKYLQERDIKIIGKYEDIDSDKWCTAERIDILQYSSYDSERIRKDADRRRAVESYLDLVLPGFDTRDMYVKLFLEICESLKLGKLDLLANELLSSEEHDAFVIYEKKGHYFFPTFDGFGYDISEFIDWHFNEIIGIRDRVNTKGYRPYVLFAKK